MTDIFVPRPLPDDQNIYYVLKKPYQMRSEIQQATQAIRNAIQNAEGDPYHPRYHFTAPANWMNDPNGTIYHDGEYHLFYQFNPYKDRWGHIHWGHAKSMDLVNWQHLPIALAPEKKLNEQHCFSGCCVIQQGTPLIVYTKIPPLSGASLFSLGSEQYLAYGDPNLVRWSKHPRNPILDQQIHPNKRIWNWRDPYIFRENGDWFMVLAGQYFGELFGSVFLYRSPNLLDWSFVGRLYRGRRELGRIWECPNYFKLGDRHMLIVSPFRQVMYSIGDFHQLKHVGNSWRIFDYGKKFYATNTYFDDRGRTIIVGWIKAKGSGGWAGCLSLPRVISLTENDQLTINPIPELSQLRGYHHSISRRAPTIAKISRIEPIFGDSLEIKARFNIKNANFAGFKLVDDSGENLLAYNYQNRAFIAIHEKAKIDIDLNLNPLELHIFIDKSIIEVFINNKVCFTTTYKSKTSYQDKSFKLIPFVSGGQGEYTIDVWELTSANITGVI